MVGYASRPRDSPCLYALNPYLAGLDGIRTPECVSMLLVCSLGGTLTPFHHSPAHQMYICEVPHCLHFKIRQDQATQYYPKRNTVVERLNKR